MRPLPSLRPPLCRGELRKVGRLQTVRFARPAYSLHSAWVGKKLEVAVHGDRSERPRRHRAAHAYTWMSLPTRVQAQLEELASREHLRPHYNLESHSVHAGQGRPS